MKFRKKKAVLLEEETRLLLTKSKLKYLTDHIETWRSTDNEVIKEALKKYIGGETWTKQKQAKGI